MKKQHKTLLNKAILSAALSMVVGTASSQALAQQLVRVNEVYQQNSTVNYRVTGNLRASASSTLSASDSAKVAEILVTEGDFVEKGQVMAKLDSRRFQANVAKQQSRVAQLKAIAEQRKFEMNNWQADFDAFNVSQKQQAVSAQKLRTTRAELNRAQAAYQAAIHEYKAGRSELDLLQIKLQDSTIRAPYDAIVIEKVADVGEWVVPGQALIKVDAKNQLQAWLEVPERFASAVSNNTTQNITLVVNDHSLFSSKVKPVFQIDKRSGSFYMVAELADTPNDLMPGMTLTGWLPLGDKKAHLYVHKNAIIRNHNGILIYKVVDSVADDKDVTKTAEAVAIKELFFKGSYVAIEAQGQLKPGDKVVIEGNQRLLPFKPVTVIESLSLRHNDSLL